jgi:hypothetical protein
MPCVNKIFPKNLIMFTYSCSPNSNCPFHSRIPSATRPKVKRPLEKLEGFIWVNTCVTYNKKWLERRCERIVLPTTTTLERWCERNDNRRPTHASFKKSLCLAKSLKFLYLQACQTIWERMPSLFVVPSPACTFEMKGWQSLKDKKYHVYGYMDLHAQCLVIRARVGCLFGLKLDNFESGYMMLWTTFEFMYYLLWI